MELGSTRNTFAGSRFRFLAHVGVGSPWRTPDLTSVFAVCPTQCNRNLTNTQSQPGGVVNPPPYTVLFSRLESLPVPCFQSFALISNRFDSRLEIAGWRRGFVAFGLSTRCRWPTL